MRTKLKEKMQLFHLLWNPLQMLKHFAYSPQMASLCKKEMNKLSCFQFQAMLTAWTEPFNMKTFTPCSQLRHGINGGQMAITFQNGFTQTCQDNGWNIGKIEAPPARVKKNKFGSLDDLFVEGNCYSQEHLFNCCAHLND
jgi:hypothetical protein